MHTELYDCLGITPEATAAQIKAAFRKMAKTLHPDAAGEESRAAFDKISLARDILLDPDRRARYDATGDANHQASPDLRLQRFMGMLTHFLEGFIQSGQDLTKIDVAEQMEMLISQSIGNGEKAAQKLEREIAAGETLAKRMKKKRKKKQPNYIIMAINSQNRERKEKLATVQDEVSTLKELQEFIGSFDYDFEAAPLWPEKFPETPIRRVSMFDITMG